jgi:hypothetical protein
VTAEASGKASSQINRKNIEWFDRHSLHVGVLLLVIIAGFWLRTMNIRWGIPDTHPYLGRTMDALHPDESVLVQQATELQEKGIFHITSLRYPPVHAQLTAILGKLSGTQNNAMRFLLARGISVAAGLASLLLIYLLGLRWNRRTALIAVAFLSVSMVAVREAHWANPEPLSAFWVLLACLILFYLEKNSSPLLFIMLGASLALGVASKYFAALLLHLPILAAFIAMQEKDSGRAGWRSVWQRLWLYAGRITLSYISFGVVIFFTLGIYVIKDPGILVQAYQSHAPWAAHNGLYGIFPKPVSVPTYIGSILPIALGIPLFAAAIIGILLSIFRRQRAGLVMIGCMLPFWLFLESIQYHPLRFCLSLAPVFCLMAAIAFDFGMSRRSRLISGLVGAVLIASVIYSGICGYSFINAMTPKNDTRLLSANWLEAHEADKARIALLGVDMKSNSMGFVKYDGLDRVSGEAYPNLSDIPEFVVVLENVGHIFRQREKLTRSGYQYSAEDWYPMVSPSAEALSFFSGLADESEYRRVQEFSANPHWGRMKFNCKALKFDLALTNLDITIYQRRHIS